MTTNTRSHPAEASSRNNVAITGRPSIGRTGFGQSSVIGRRRLPSPAAITTAHADYAKSAFEAHKAYLEKLATVKAPDQAMQLTTDHMKSAYETFVAESQKIGEMYKSFFTTALKPMTAAMTPALHVV